MAGSGGALGGSSSIDASCTVLSGEDLCLGHGPELARRTAAAHLRLLGANMAPPSGALEPDVGLSWYGPGLWKAGTPGSEAVVQAVSGLMEVHGREMGRPRPLGLAVASVAAGILASQASLASVLGRSRGIAVRRAHTSVLEAAMLLLTPYVAMATTDGWTTPPPAATSGPPFPTSDGEWVELEALDSETWKAFWARIGLEGPVVGRAWRSFLARYETATCPLPAELHAATRNSTLAELVAAAKATDVALCPLRTPAEALACPIRPPWRVSVARGVPAPPPSKGPTGTLPLSGIRVVEATSRLQGPLAGHILQMLGAEVLRIEPLGGDFARAMPPLAGDLGAVFLALNAGKQPVELDLKRPEGRTELLELVASADVFLHNWRPGRAAQLGVDSDRCAAVNSFLVFGHASGWGSDDARVATDYLVQAHAGLGYLLNSADEPPFPSRLVVADLMGGLVAAEALLAGLVLRERSGRGCRVDTSLLGAALALETHALDAVAQSGERSRSIERPLWGLLDVPLQTAAGLLALTVEGDDQLSHLCRVSGSRKGREQSVVKRLREHTAPEWERILSNAGLPAGKVCVDLADLNKDRRMRTLLQPMDHCVVPAPPWRFEC